MTLGLTITVEKVYESDSSAVYSFFVRDGQGGTIVPHATARVGRLAIDKSTGEVTIIEPCPDDVQDQLSGRAAFAVRKQWKSGALPSVAYWVS